MGVEALRAALEEQGRARVAQVVAEGEAEAARLLEAARAEAERRRAERLAVEEVALRRAAHSRLAAARREARRRVLEAREALLERVFARLADELAHALAAPEARGWLAARAREAVAYLPDGPVVVKVSPALVPLIAETLSGREGLLVEGDAEIPAGFRASGAGGALVVDATAPRLIERERHALAGEALRWLASARPSAGGA